MRTLEIQETQMLAGGVDPLFVLTFVAGTSLVLGLYNSARIQTLTESVSAVNSHISTLPFVY